MLMLLILAFFGGARGNDCSWCLRFLALFGAAGGNDAHNAFDSLLSLVPLAAMMLVMFPMLCSSWVHIGAACSNDAHDTFDRWLCCFAFGAAPGNDAHDTSDCLPCIGAARSEDVDDASLFLFWCRPWQ